MYRSYGYGGGYLALWLGGYSVAFIIGIALAAMLATVYIPRWYIFKKAGEKGWKALIPFYSDYVYYKIAWDGKVYLIQLLGVVAAAIGGLIICLIPILGAIVAAVLFMVAFALAAILPLMVQFKMAHAFGRSDWFGLGLAVASPLFQMILAFGDSAYEGKKEDGIDLPDFLKGGRKPKAPKYPYAQNQYAPYGQQYPQQPYQQQAYQPQQQPYQPQQQAYQQPADEDYDQQD